jgi:hypothetical protein
VESIFVVEYLREHESIFETVFAHESEFCGASSLKGQAHEKSMSSEHVGSMPDTSNKNHWPVLNFSDYPFKSMIFENDLLYLQKAFTMYNVNCPPPPLDWEPAGDPPG